MLTKTFLLLGSANALLAVVFGAFGAHALKHRLTEQYLKTFETGVDYHFYHAIGLLIVAILVHQYPSSSGILKWSGWAMFAGILLFSGSLYILSMTQIRWFGAITPIGGIAFIVAWLCLFIGVIKS